MGTADKSTIAGSKLSLIGGIASKLSIIESSFSIVQVLRTIRLPTMLHHENQTNQTLLRRHTGGVRALSSV
jgi:hypothetical protein